MKLGMTYHLTQVKMDTILESTNNKFWRWCGEKGTPLTLLVGLQTRTGTMKSSVEIS